MNPGSHRTSVIVGLLYIGGLWVVSHRFVPFVRMWVWLNSHYNDVTISTVENMAMGTGKDQGQPKGAPTPEPPKGFPAAGPFPPGPGIGGIR